MKIFNRINIIDLLWLEPKRNLGCFWIVKFLQYKIYKFHLMQTFDDLFYSRYNFPHLHTKNSIKGHVNRKKLRKYSIRLNFSQIVRLILP